MCTHHTLKCARTGESKQTGRLWSRLTHGPSRLSQKWEQLERLLQASLVRGWGGALGVSGVGQASAAGRNPAMAQKLLSWAVRRLGLALAYLALPNSVIRSGGCEAVLGEGALDGVPATQMLEPSL